MTFKRVLVVSLGLLSVGSIASATDVTGQLTFVGITPCRIIETRTGQGFSGTNGPPSLVANATRTFQITGTVTGLPAQCGVPDTAVAISVNFTVTGFAGQGDIRVFPAGGTLPLASILNYQLENIANATSVPLGPSGGGHNGITVQADAAGTDFIADVNGYYLPASTLPSGQTLRGQYAVTGTASAVNQLFGSPVSFHPSVSGLTPGSAPAANFIPGGPPTTNCPGTASNPQAARGNFCAYESTAVNRNFYCFLDGSTNACGASTTGTGVWFVSAAAGSVYSAGTWAVTAP